MQHLPVLAAIFASGIWIGWQLTGRLLGDRTRQMSQAERADDGQSSDPRPADGRQTDLRGAKRAYLFVCAKGCCCGRTDRGHAAVPIDFYKDEYKRRRLRLANAAFDERLPRAMLDGQRSAAGLRWPSRSGSNRSITSRKSWRVYDYME